MVIIKENGMWVLTKSKFLSIIAVRYLTSSDGPNNSVFSTFGEGIDEPGKEEPAIDGPGTDGPAIDGPGICGPGMDGPGTDGPRIGPLTDEPGRYGPRTDNPGTCGPEILDGPANSYYEVKLKKINK